MSQEVKWAGSGNKPCGMLTPQQKASEASVLGTRPDTEQAQSG